MRIEDSPGDGRSQSRQIKPGDMRIPVVVDTVRAARYAGPSFLRTRIGCEGSQDDADIRVRV